MTTSALSRRAFLQAAAATTGGVLVSGPLETLVASAAGATPPPAGLVPVADLRDGKVRLHLPSGFAYRSFHDTDTLLPPPPAPPVAPPVILQDGTVLPGRHDGMAAFPSRRPGHVWLVRNHEVNGPVAAAFGPGRPYDAHAGGGTTSIEVSEDGVVARAFTSLNGTQMNCSGGPMPWGSWITCEETVNGPDVGPDFTGASNVALEQRHGFLFEVPAGGQSNRRPITAAGRFAHEAAVYSPHDCAVYLTEDNFGFPSGLYRYRPPLDPMRVRYLANGGRLQMLRVVGQPNAHLEADQVMGVSYKVDWVDIDDPDPTFPYTPGETAPTTNNEAINHVGNQGRVQGAAHFSRLEGATYTKGEVFFTSTQGGGAAETGPDTVTGYGNGTGQVWSYEPRGQRLTCRYQSPGTSALELPDNITARSNRGTLVICEDGPADNYIRGLGRRGGLFDLAVNRLTRNNPSPDGTFATRFGEEFAGATFSPRGGTLFVNIQAAQAITFAIWGPWSRVGV
jgi:secreted PhoX family phosphatase